MSPPPPRSPSQISSLLTTCSTLPSLKRIHALLVTHDLLSTHLPAATKLLSLYARLSPSAPHHAHHLFDAIPHPDAFLFNTLLRAYSDRGPLAHIFPLYRRMHALHVPPDRFTFPFVLRSCALLSDLRGGRQAHCHALKHGLSSDTYFSTAAIVMYFNCGEIPDSESVFGLCSERNVVLWTSVVAGYVQNSVFGRAVVVFREMVTVGGVVPNEVTLVSVLPACNGPEWLRSGMAVHGFATKLGLDRFDTLSNALVSMYGKCGDLRVARRLFDGMEGSRSSVVSWNAMIAVYEQGGDGSNAVELFRRMVADEEVGFNAVTLVSVVSACTRLGALDTGKWVHELARRRGLETDVRVGNALLDMYSKCGSLDSARDVFERLQSRGVVSWSAMIGAYASHGLAREALELFDRMEAEGVRPNSFTFTGVLAACSHAGLVEEGMKHFGRMRSEYGTSPTLEHCACMVDLLGRAGRLREAHEFVKEMEVKPDTGVWGALLGACRIHEDVEMAERVADDLFKVEPHNVTFYVLMSNIYADAGKWEGAARMRKLLKKQGLKKIPGRSCLESSK